MAGLENSQRGTTTLANESAELRQARDLYIVGGKESDRKAMEILLRVFEASKDSSERVPLEKIDSLPQLVHLLITQGEREKAGQWAATLWNSIKEKEQWLKRETLQDCYVWASKGLAFAGRLKEALKVEERCVAHVAPRAERPGRAVTQSLFRAAIYHCQQGEMTRGLIKATQASDIGCRFLQGSHEDAQMLFELLLFVKHLQEKAGAPQREIQRTRHRLTATTLLLSKTSTSS
jgi:hypothetical protein